MCGWRIFVVSVCFWQVYLSLNGFLEKPMYAGPGQFFMQTIATSFCDCARIQKNFLSMDTVKIMTATVPCYLFTRFVDTPIHGCFYDAAHHKNIHQMHHGFCTVAAKASNVGVLLYSSLALLAPDPYTRRAARIFGIGFLSAMVFKNIIKTIDTGAALRPKNEHFCKDKKTFGGFPSGHMIEATYLATVLGLEYGLKAAIPLGVGAGIMFGVLVGCNRHYTSQVVAGLGVGLAYGVATYKVIHCDDRKNFSLFGGPSRIGISYCF